MTSAGLQNIRATVTALILHMRSMLCRTNVPEEEIRAAIGSRDLSKKGLERRQRDYINRTVEKARALYGCSGIPLHGSSGSCARP
jgi:hypothetical protein